MVLGNTCGQGYRLQLPNNLFLIKNLKQVSQIEILHAAAFALFSK
jgi:hypothetical protein